MLQNALQNIPNPASECMLRNVAIRLAQQIFEEVPYFHMQSQHTSNKHALMSLFMVLNVNHSQHKISHYPQNFFQASKYIPDISVIRAVQKIVWASACGSIQLVFSSSEEISKIYVKVKVPKIQGKRPTLFPCFSFDFIIAYVLTAGLFNLLTLSHS